jgi:hypothetical protein
MDWLPKELANELARELASPAKYAQEGMSQKTSSGLEVVSCPGI